MVDVVIQGVCVLYRMNNDKGDASLRLLAFRRHFANVIFLQYSEESRLSLRQLGIPNISSDVYYDDTKDYQVQSERWRIKNPFKYLKGNALA